MRCAIHSADSGSIIVIPREKKLVRLYIQLNEVSSKDKQVDRSKITPEVILESARKIMSPYKLSYHYCDWWTAYQVGKSIDTPIGIINRVADWPACWQLFRCRSER